LTIAMDQVARTVKAALRGCGALDVVTHATARGRLEVLLYHGFCERSERDLRHPQLMPIERFERQIRALSRYGRPVHLEDAVDDRVQGIAVTFDDGYANNYHLALPVLERYQFPATIFVTTGFVDRTVPLWGDWLEFLLTSAPRRNSVFGWKNESIVLPLAAPEAASGVFAQLKQRLRLEAIGEIHEFLRALETHLEFRYDWNSIPEALRPLDWEQIRAMRRSGLVSFGAHTVSHPVLSRCTRKTRRQEILQSKRRLEEELGEACRTFAYPFGKYTDYTPETTKIVREAGFELGVSAESGCNLRSSWDAYELKRWGADLSVEEVSFLVAGGPVVSNYMRRCFGGL
jgi:peptidoglycan/xylan/chitin deacetylase (PgdA/CDA1 family)